jgi:hypothetical protein
MGRSIELRAMKDNLERLSAYGTLRTWVSTLRCPLLGGEADILNPRCQVRIWLCRDDCREQFLKLQIKAVASPRNHLYRTGHPLVDAGLFFIGADAKFDHLCDLTHNLDFQTVLRRSY